ncbi:hypothetical protein GOV11_04965 [Candidatus Woesearchaeota archaeon]|nr:hypothetical protein [Candidatus Woesearchaeota archaeon]
MTISGGNNLVSTCGHIETGPDKLLSLVNENHEISTVNAANQLKVDKTTVEAWADLLEDAEMIRYMPSFNGTVLCTTETKNSGFTKMIKKGAFSLKKKKLHNEQFLNQRLDEIRGSLKLLDSKLKQYKKYQRLCAQAKERDRMANQKVKRLEKLQNKIERMHKSLTKERDVIESHEDRLNKERLQIKQDKAHIKLQKYEMVQKRKTFDKELNKFITERLKKIE